MSRSFPRRFLCAFTPCFIAFVSCFTLYSPLSVSAALDYSEQTKIDDYLDLYTDRQNQVEFELDKSSDGDLSIRLQIAGLQRLALNTQTNIYNNLDFSTAPNSFSVSGVSGASGLYRSYVDGLVHFVSIFSISEFGQPLAVSDEFSFTVIVSPPTHSVTPYFTSNSERIFRGFSNSLSIYNSSFTFTGNSSYFTSYSSSSPNIGLGNSLVNLSYSGIPTLYQNHLPRSFYFSVNFGGNAVDLSLPDSDFPSATPWDYYNDTLLPYIRNNFNINNIDDYLVFPNGYSPSQDPTEPYDPSNPSLPSVIPVIIPVVIGGLEILMPVNGTLNVDGIDIYFPDDTHINIGGTDYDIPLDMDISGHHFECSEKNTVIIDGVTFVFNDDGSLTINDEVFNPPIGQPETLPSYPDNVEFSVEIPTLQDIKVPQPDYTLFSLASIPQDVMDGVSFIFAGVYDILDSSGILPLLPFFVTISAITYAIYKIGG